jgi:hypothetical protein
VSKHQKSRSKLDLFYFPFRGQKNPSAEHHFLPGISDSSSRAQKISYPRHLSTGFSANPSHREGQMNLSAMEFHARVFLLFFDGIIQLINQQSNIVDFPGF